MYCNTINPLKNCNTIHKISQINILPSFATYPVSDVIF